MISHICGWVNKFNESLKEILTEAMGKEHGSFIIVQSKGNIVKGTFWTEVRKLYDSVEENTPARKLAIYEALQRKDDRGEGNNEQ
ncbi:Hypothetical predicted protein [Mytilus galloprovincialis]|uniref:Uncharacterized protein n=1 Tax=Mytilus galloprovincialis TaxID=29158 RepID=A0A8B6EZP7_MYTGA|nr:Hypothetical predicted protein [Mytilus galloprovincialis]